MSFGEHAHFKYKTCGHAQLYRVAMGILASNTYEHAQLVLMHTQSKGMSLKSI